MTLAGELPGSPPFVRQILQVLKKGPASCSRGKGNPTPNPTFPENWSGAEATLPIRQATQRNERRLLGLGPLRGAVTFGTLSRIVGVLPTGRANRDSWLHAQALGQNRMTCWSNLAKEKCTVSLMTDSRHYVATSAYKGSVRKVVTHTQRAPAHQGFVEDAAPPHPEPPPVLHHSWPPFL